MNNNIQFKIQQASSPTETSFFKEIQSLKVANSMFFMSFERLIVLNDLQLEKAPSLILSTLVGTVYSSIFLSPASQKKKKKHMTECVF